MSFDRRTTIDGDKLFYISPALKPFAFNRDGDTILCLRMIVFVHRYFLLLFVVVMVVLMVLTVMIVVEVVVVVVTVVVVLIVVVFLVG